MGASKSKNRKRPHDEMNEVANAAASPTAATAQDRVQAVGPGVEQGMRIPSVSSAGSPPQPPRAPPNGPVPPHRPAVQGEPGPRREARRVEPEQARQNPVANTDVARPAVPRAAPQTAPPLVVAANDAANVGDGARELSCDYSS